MSKPYSMRSNALDKSIKTAPVKRLLSSVVFQFSMSLIKPFNRVCNRKQLNNLKALLEYPEFYVVAY